MTKKVEIQNGANNSNAVKTEAHDRGVNKYELAEENHQRMIAELPTDKGWGEGWNSSRVAKTYSEEGFVQSMSISVETDLRECKSWFQVICLGGICACDGVQADTLQKETAELHEKRFYSISEAEQAADAFAARWNSVDTKSKTAVPVETIDKLKAALPALEAKIESLTGHKVTLQVESYTDHYSERECYNFFSDDFSANLCGLAKPIFERINIKTRGSKFNSETGLIGFSPIVEYVHHGGGRNGTEYIWSWLFFDVAKGEWDFERSRQIFNKAETHKKENQTVEIKTIERRIFDLKQEFILNKEKYQTCDEYDDEQTWERTII